MFFRRKESIIDPNIIKSIYAKDKLVRYAEFLAGLFLVSFAFNVFLLPSQVVYGVSGVAVMLNKLFHLDPSFVILIVKLDIFRKRENCKYSDWFFIISCICKTY